MVRTQNFESNSAQNCMCVLERDLIQYEKSYSRLKSCKKKSQNDYFAYISQRNKS